VPSIKPRARTTLPLSAIETRIAAELRGNRGQREGESPVPVRAEGDEDLARSHAVIAHRAGDELKRAGVTPGVLGIANRVSAIGPETAVITPRLALEHEQLGDSGAIVGGASHPCGIR
jgi:hypothetical protein